MGCDGTKKACYIPSQLQRRGISYAESKTKYQPAKHCKLYSSEIPDRPRDRKAHGLCPQAQPLVAWIAAHRRHRGSELARSGALKRAWMCVRQMRPPGRGDFWILKVAHAPSCKNLSKNGFCPLKGGSLSDGRRFCKKILVR